MAWGFTILYIIVHHVFDISTWRLNVLSKQVWLRHPVMRFMSIYFLLRITSVAASCNKSWYLSSSSAWPPVLEVLCIDGKPSDTPSSIDPGKRRKKNYSYCSRLLNFWLHNNDEVRLIQLFPLVGLRAPFGGPPGGSGTAKRLDFFFFFIIYKVSYFY